MSLRALDRKVLRDLLGMKGQVLAICMVIASGVATFVMSLSTLDSLKETQTAYYERFRFAEIFTGATRAPKSLEQRVTEIPGVARVQTRVQADVTLDVPGLAEPAVGRLISIPEFGRPVLNDLYLRRGRWIEPRQRGEVLVSEAFADAHRFQLGDTLRAILNGRRQELRIVGVVLSPEYIFQLRQGDMLPDDRRFGVFWMGQEQLEAAFDMEGAFNSVALTKLRGASDAEIIRRLDRLLEPYGSPGAYGRNDQISHRYLSDEIAQLGSMALIAPTIFLGVAAFLLNVVLTRLIGMQREQIAALKAFGHTRVEVGIHYGKMILVIVMLGTIAGTGIGARMGLGLTSMYTEFYRFPFLQYRFDGGVVFLAVAISSLAGLAGTFVAVRRAVKLPPAEAMRPEPPKDFRPTLVERAGLQQFFSQAMRMTLRHLERQPVKSLLSALGIAMAVAVLIMGSFMEDALDYLIDFQFHLSQRQDMIVTLVEPTSADSLYELAHFPGVLAAEPFRTVVVRIRAGHRSRRLAIMGLRPDARLFHILDASEQRVALPPDGLVISDKLAALLDSQTGDHVRIEVLEGARPVRSIPVVGTVADFSGLSAYMNLEALHRLMREGGSLSGAYLTVDPLQSERLYTVLKNTPGVANVSVKRATLEAFHETIAENLLRMRSFNVLFATVIAFGVVYNTARISLSERSRELATLRVIGFTRREISAILLGELGVLTLIAIPLGLGLGFIFAKASSLALNTEMYRIPFVIHSDTYAFATVVVLVATLISGLIVRRRLDSLDLISVLKTKE